MRKRNAVEDKRKLELLIEVPSEYSLSYVASIFIDFDDYDKATIDEFFEKVKLKGIREV